MDCSIKSNSWWIEELQEIICGSERQRKPSDKYTFLVYLKMIHRFWKTEMGVCKQEKTQLNTTDKTTKSMKSNFPQAQVINKG